MADGERDEVWGEKISDDAEEEDCEGEAGEDGVGEFVGLFLLVFFQGSR